MRGADPADAGRVLKTLVDVWDVASERMLVKVARRLARGIDEPGWAERKSREVLVVSGEMRALAQQAASGPQAVKALEEAYALGEKAAETLGQKFVSTNSLRVTRLARILVEKLQGVVLPVQRAHEDLFQRAVNDTELLMQTGTIVRREAVASAVERLLADRAGDPAADRFEAQDGRRWHLDSYVRMAGRTMAQQAMIEGQLEGMTARGKDLVLISDSPRECRLCEPWEGKLLSITGASVGDEVDGHEVVATVTTARLDGLWHPNCTHRADPFVPGLTIVREAVANPDGYEQTQTLRRLEREQRQLRRNHAAVRELGDTMAARELRRKIRAKDLRIQEYAEATGQNRRRERERPVDA